MVSSIWFILLIASVYARSPISEECFRALNDYFQCVNVGKEDLQIGVDLSDKETIIKDGCSWLTKLADCSIPVDCVSSQEQLEELVTVRTTWLDLFRGVPGWDSTTCPAATSLREGNLTRINESVETDSGETNSDEDEDDNSDSYSK